MITVTETFSRDPRKGRELLFSFSRDDRKGPELLFSFSRDDRKGPELLFSFSRDDRKGRKLLFCFSRDDRNRREPQFSFSRDARKGPELQDCFRAPLENVGAAGSLFLPSAEQSYPPFVHRLRPMNWPSWALGIELVWLAIGPGSGSEYGRYVQSSQAARWGLDPEVQATIDREGSKKAAARALNCSENEHTPYDAPRVRRK